MINVIQNQETLIYVVDADTKLLIRGNLTYNRYESTKEPGIINYNAIYGGTMHAEFGVSDGGISSRTIDFEESQITKLGYDYKSITGNVISSSYDPELDAYLFPSVAIIYMSKLK